MNLLYLDWPCYGKEGTIKAFEKLGYNVYEFFDGDYQERKSEKFDANILKFVEKNDIDICFSYNFYPVLSEFCHKKNMKYIAFVYDSPYGMLYSYTLMYDTNYVFLFDSYQYLELRNGGLKNVYYMVLPTDPENIKKKLKTDYNENRVKCDISFMGQLYNEEHNFYERIIEKNNLYLNGYLDAVVEAQQKVQGYNFVEKTLTSNIVNMIYEAFPYDVDKYSVEKPTYAYENYVINRKVTQMERKRILEKIGAKFPGKCKLFTWEQSAKIPGIKNMGVAVYETEMNLVFNKSKINLNISLRSIKNGIPLRCIDIMGSGGFLLTNYQEDLFRDFEPGVEFDYYEDDEDLVRKIEYYLQHDEERKKIAENGYKKICERFTFEKVFGKIFEIVNNAKD
ncbi:spore maturation protein CgeB [Lachnospiraceae bacterium C7]|nr:spore maturation protein CgeB [Lachnospiraceae bacterium C7]